MKSIELKFVKNDIAFFVKSPSEIHRVQIKSTGVTHDGVAPDIKYTTEDGRVFPEKDLLTREELLKVI